jgi:hypothetical protein
MSNQRKSPRDKPDNAIASNGKSPGGRKAKAPAKKEPKQKTIAAEIEPAGRREAAPPSAPAAKPRQAATADPKPIETAKAAPAAPKPAQAKPAAPVAKRATAAPMPAPKPAVPKSASTPDAAPHVLGSAVDTFERTVKAAGQGTLAVNCKLLDFARANVNSSLDYVKDLAAARSPVRVMRLQMEFWQDCLETFASQAQELRALSAELAANANEPLRQQMRKPRRPAA